MASRLIPNSYNSAAGDRQRRQDCAHLLRGRHPAGLLAGHPSCTLYCQFGVIGTTKLWYYEAVNGSVAAGQTVKAACVSLSDGSDHMENRSGCGVRL